MNYLKTFESFVFFKFFRKMSVKILFLDIKK